MFLDLLCVKKGSDLLLFHMKKISSIKRNHTKGDNPVFLERLERSERLSSWAQQAILMIVNYF